MTEEYYFYAGAVVLSLIVILFIYGRRDRSIKIGFDAIKGDWSLMEGEEKIKESSIWPESEFLVDNYHIMRERSSSINPQESNFNLIKGRWPKGNVETESMGVRPALTDDEKVKLKDYQQDLISKVRPDFKRGLTKFHRNTEGSWATVGGEEYPIGQVPWEDTDGMVTRKTMTVEDAKSQGYFQTTGRLNRNLLSPYQKRVLGFIATTKKGDSFTMKELYIVAYGTSFHDNKPYQTLYNFVNRKLIPSGILVKQDSKYYKA